MVDPKKKVKSSKSVISETAPIEDEYELLPHKEIVELKDELRRLKSMPTGSGKDIPLGDLSEKIDRLLEIFTDAMHQMKIEEGGISFHEKMKPFSDKMNKILEQNSEIAEGIVALADIMNEVKTNVEEKMSAPRLGMPRSSVRPRLAPTPGIGPQPGMPIGGPPPGLKPMSAPPRPPAPGAPQGMPGMGGMPPVPPPPKKKGLFR